MNITVCVRSKPGDPTQSANPNNKETERKKEKVVDEEDDNEADNKAAMAVCHTHMSHSGLPEIHHHRV